MGGLWLYGADRWGVDQANAYARRLHASFARIAALPRLGRQFQSGNMTVRVFPVEAHILVYREDPDGILILRVLAARQDWLAQLITSD